MVTYSCPLSGLEIRVHAIFLCRTAACAQGFFADADDEPRCEQVLDDAAGIAVRDAHLLGNLA